MNLDILKAVRCDPFKIHLGCAGDIKEGYFNVDTVHPPGLSKIGSDTYTVGMDALEFLRHVPYETCEKIVSSFFIEHICIEDLLDLVGIFFDVLEVGGTMIHETDDFECLSKRFLSIDSKEVDMLSLINLNKYLYSYEMYGSHRSAWTKDLLRWFFSTVPEFRVDRIYSSEGWESIVVEVTKFRGRDKVL